MAIALPSGSHTGRPSPKGAGINVSPDNNHGGPRDEPPALSSRMVKDLVQVFKLLSDETRLRILLFLIKQKELHVRALCEQLGQSQPAVSHHLALLRVAGLIEPRREGKHNFYRILPERFQELLDMVFASIPEHERHIRFEDYTLRHEPEERPVL